MKKENRDREKKEMVLIQWTDASIHSQSDVIWEDDLSQCHLVDGLSAGIVVREDKESITIATDWFYKEKNFRGCRTYPKSGIIKIIRKDIKPL